MNNKTKNKIIMIKGETPQVQPLLSMKSAKTAVTVKLRLTNRNNLKNTIRIIPILLII